MYLTDLAFIEEGTPNYTEDGLVNFSKMRMVSFTGQSVGLQAQTQVPDHQACSVGHVLPGEPGAPLEAQAASGRPSDEANRLRGRRPWQGASHKPEEQPEARGAGGAVSDPARSPRGGRAEPGLEPWLLVPFCGAWGGGGHGDSKLSS